MNLKLKAKDHSRKMTKEEVRELLKLRRGNGTHKNKKAYDRKREKRQHIHKYS